MADLINNPIIIKKAYDHLSNDPVLKYLIEKFGDKWATNKFQSCY